MEKLAKLSKEFGLELSDYQLLQFQKYYDWLMEKNKVMNLTAITKKEEVIVKHFLDSLSICKIVQFKQDIFGEKAEQSEKEIKLRENIICTEDAYKSCNQTFDEIQKVKMPFNCKILDIGTGAGFPGVPLKIAFPETKLVLADSLNKRIHFLKEVISELDLKNIYAVHGRAEELARKEEYREKFQLCVSRAVANLSVLVEYCLPFIELGGYFISYKSPNIEQELLESKKAISVLGGKLIGNIPFILPQSDIGRNFIIIKKIKSTSKKYPRNAGKPAKEPIHS